MLTASIIDVMVAVSSEQAFYRDVFAQHKTGNEEKLIV